MTPVPLLVIHHNRPSRRQPRWWTNESFRALVIQPGAPIAALGFPLTSFTDVSSFIALCAPHVVHSGDNGSMTSSRSTTGTPNLSESDLTLFPAFPHGLRPPLGLGRQALTPTPFPCLRQMAVVFLVCFPRHPLLLDFYNLISYLTSASSSGPFDAAFSAPELAQALAQCHDSTPGRDPYFAFRPDLAWHAAPIFQRGPALEHGVGGVEDQHNHSSQT